MAQVQLSVNPETLVVKVGGEANLQINVEGDESYTVTSDNNNVSITDNDEGNGKKITGIIAGSSILTVRPTKESSEETVKEIPVVIDNNDGTPLLKVENAKISIKEADGAKTIDVETTVDDFTVEADNDNVAVAKVDSEKQITITPNKGGESVVTIKAMSKSGVLGTLTINVTVIATPTLELEPTESTFKVNKEQIISITTNQSDFSYTIVPEDVVTVVKGDNKLTLTGIKVGTAVVTVTTVSATGEVEAINKTANINVTEPDITRLNVTPAELTITVGGKANITVDTNDTNYQVTNSGSGIVSFEKSTGVVTADAVGSATLTFTAKYGEGEELVKKVVITVEAVPAEPTTLVVTPNTPANLIKGDKITFNVETNADDYDVEFSNDSIADYDKSTHTLTSKGVGNTSVKFKATLDGSDTKEVSVDVNVADTTLTAGSTDLSIKIGEEDSFNIVSNIVGEAKIEADNQEKIAVSKNSDKVIVNALETGNANVIITARDKTLLVPVKVYDLTELEVSDKPSKIYLGKDLIVEVSTNATEFKAESLDPAIVKLVKVENKLYLSSQADGTTKIKISAQVEGGEEVIIEWDILSILETTYTKEESDAILTDPKTTVLEKLNKFANDVGEYGVFVNNLINYNTDMDPNAESTLSDEKGAAKNYNLYIQLKDAVETEDYLSFKVKFDIINMAYTVFSKQAFDEFALFRYDQAWSSKWGEESLTTFQNLNTVICTLCNIKTRAASLSGLDLDKALDHTVLEITELGINNIKKYYTV